MRMIRKPIAKQVLKKKSQLKITETMKIELILSQVFFFLRKYLNLMHTMSLKGKRMRCEKDSSFESEL